MPASCLINYISIYQHIAIYNHQRTITSLFTIKVISKLLTYHYMEHNQIITVANDVLKYVN